ncbi:unnamed protein product [Sphagnum troendelagicum]|uniref:Uncharacterized protein n=1 Tax=Sphagnum troendelagicum TaxID=128251 RepID=A0ABP0U394_9BRYO
MHKVIQDEVRTLGPKKLCYLPSYLVQLYAYGDCQLVIERHHKVLVRRAIKEVYGTSEDELTNEEEATYEETEEESIEVPLEDYGETEGGDHSFLHELRSATEYKYDGTFDGSSSSGLTDQGSEIQGGMGTTQIPIDYMDPRMEQLYPSLELGDEEDERLTTVEVEKEEWDYV